MLVNSIKLMDQKFQHFINKDLTEIKRNYLIINLLYNVRYDLI